MGRFCVLCMGFVVALAAAGPVSASYPWPVRPFDRQHPIRGSFGDPRTVFQDPLFADGLNGPGSFSFHNGVDIAAPNGTTVYPVLSGVAHLVDATAISVETLDGRTFQYFHVIPTVVDGEKVTARLSMLGYVQAPYAHVHLSEIDGTRIANPLQKGHLAPYVDRTRPQVDTIELRDSDGRLTGPLGVCGRVSLAAEAFDRPAVPVAGPFKGLPVAPALVAWQLQRLGGAVVVPRTIAADFRVTLPPPADFWKIYARGSYQNAPRFGNQQFGSMPGRFLYQLNPSLDTKTLPNGVYILTATASDERRNVGSLALRFSVLNVRTASGCPAPPPPPTEPPSQPQPTPPATTTGPPPAP